MDDPAQGIHPGFVMIGAIKDRHGFGKHFSVFYPEFPDFIGGFELSRPIPIQLAELAVAIPLWMAFQVFHP